MCVTQLKEKVKGNSRLRSHMRPYIIIKDDSSESSINVNEMFNELLFSKMQINLLLHSVCTIFAFQNQVDYEKRKPSDIRPQCGGVRHRSC